MTILFPRSTETFCVLLAGGQGTRLHELTATDCKPALPFAGGRLIDFTLENAARSGLRQVLVATQYRAASLTGHLERRWASRFADGLQIRDGSRMTGPGYRGTADAVRVNLAEIICSDADTVLVLSADHVYRMDYGAMVAAHRASGAAVTVAADTAPLAQASSFGVLAADARGAVTAFAEKPARPVPMPDDPARTLVSMGVYVFDRRWLSAALADGDRHDFGNDILPRAVAERVCHAHRPAPKEGTAFYWRDVGTLDGYRQTHLDFLTGAAAPFAPPWNICHSPQACRAAQSGTVLMPGASLGARTRLSRTIVAPGVHVPDGLVAGHDAQEDSRWFRTTPGHTVLITAAMAARWRDAHGKGRLGWRPHLGALEA